jgi:ABC-2 type transport system permease protein
LGLFYLYLLGHYSPLRRVAQRSAGEEVELLSRAWGFVLAVAAAPVVEEMIFRGLIFRPLRRNHGLIVSMLASSLLFAIIHDPLSIPPVFVLGCCAALAFERSGSIITPMLVHAAYNASIALAQPLAN